MSTPANKLNDDQRMEYQEIGEFARHDDTIHLTMSSVLIPVLIGALGWAWEHHDVAIPLAFGSLVTWVYWFAVKRRRMDFLRLRLKRARDLEAIGQLEHHRTIRTSDLSRPGWTAVADIKRMERVVSIGLFWAWLWLFLPIIPIWMAVILVLVPTVVAIAADVREDRNRRAVA
jgi:hypothetical protein